MVQDGESRGSVTIGDRCADGGPLPWRPGAIRSDGAARQNVLVGAGGGGGGCQRFLVLRVLLRPALAERPELLVALMCCRSRPCGVGVQGSLRQEPRGSLERVLRAQSARHRHLLCKAGDAAMRDSGLRHQLPPCPKPASSNV